MEWASNITASWVAVALCALRASTPHPPQDKPTAPLRLEAQPLRDTVQAGEPIYLRLRLENVGDTNVLVNRRFHLNYTVWLDVRGPEEGQKQEWCGIIPDFAVLPGDFVSLAPRAHVEGRVRANCAAKGVTWGYRFPGAGQYTIVVTYELTWPLAELRKAAGSALVVRGPVLAKPVRLTVLPPEKPALQHPASGQWPRLPTMPPTG